MKALPGPPGESTLKLRTPIAKRRLFFGMWSYGEPWHLHDEGDELDQVIETTKTRLRELLRLRRDGVHGTWQPEDGGFLWTDTDDPAVAEKHGMDEVSIGDEEEDADQEPIPEQ